MAKTSVKIKPVKVLKAELDLLTVNGSIGIGADDFQVNYSLSKAPEEGERVYGSALGLANQNGYNGSITISKDSIKDLNDETIIAEVLNQLSLTAE